MDRLRVHRESPKKAKAKKQPIKVVYFSNPMRVKATASEFKGVVQELTGRDSDVGDLFKFTGEESGSGQDDFDVGTSVGVGDIDHQHRGWQQQQQGVPVDVFDDVFTWQVLENLAEFMPSSLHYEPLPPVDNIGRRG